MVYRSHQDQEHSDPLNPVAYFVLDDDWFVSCSFCTSFVGFRLSVYCYLCVSGKFQIFEEMELMMEIWRFNKNKMIVAPSGL